jgi:hypothetical protein
MVGERQVIVGSFRFGDSEREESPGSAGQDGS